MDKALLFCSVVFILVASVLFGCRGTKEANRGHVRVIDTLHVTDTVIRVLVDTVRSVEIREVSGRWQEKNDSVVVKVVRDTIVIKKYGTDRRSESRSVYELENSRYTVDSLSVRRNVVSFTDSTHASQAIPKEVKRKKWSFWKWVAILEFGAIITLSIFASARKLPFGIISRIFKKSKS